MQEGDKTDAFNVALDHAFEGAFASITEGARKYTSEIALKSVLRNLYKDPQEFPFKCAFKGELEFTVELQLRLHLLMHLSM